jgi:hypothetical protein
MIMKGCTASRSRFILQVMIMLNYVLLAYILFDVAINIAKLCINL